MKVLLVVLIFSLSAPRAVAQHLNIKLDDLLHKVDTMQGVRPGPKHYVKSSGFDFSKLRPIKTKGKFCFQITYNEKGQIDQIDMGKANDKTIWTFECFEVDKSIIYINILIRDSAKGDTVMYASTAEFMILDLKKGQLMRFDRERSNYMLLDSFLRPLTNLHIADDKIVGRKKITENNGKAIVEHFLPKKEITITNEFTLKELFGFLTSNSDFKFEQKITLKENLELYDFDHNLKIID